MGEISIYNIPVQGYMLIGKATSKRVLCTSIFRGNKQVVVCSFLSWLQNLLQAEKHLWFRSRGFRVDNLISCPAPHTLLPIPKVLPHKRQPHLYIAIAWKLISLFQPGFKQWSSNDGILHSFFIMSIFTNEYFSCHT